MFGVAAAAPRAACGDPELDRLTGVRDRACACHDLACGEAALVDVPAVDVHPTPRAQALANEIFRCVAHLKAAAVEAGSGSDALDAPTGSAGAATGSAGVADGSA